MLVSSTHETDGIVSMMGSRVVVESEVGEGSTFSFEAGFG